MNNEKSVLKKVGLQTSDLQEVQPRKTWVQPELRKIDAGSSTDAKPVYFASETPGGWGPS